MDNKPDYGEYFKQLQAEGVEAEIIYKKLLEEDKDKNYMDLLPQDFSNFHRSIIKRDILAHIDRVTDHLNNCPLYDGRVFDKKDVVRYMLSYTDNYTLARMFIPHKSSMALYAKEADLPPKQFKAKEKLYEDLQIEIQWLSQSWNLYLQKQMILNKDIVSGDFEDDGFPRASRLNLCWMFVPVDGKWRKNKKGTVELYNPRSKKDETYKLLEWKAEDNVYKAENPKGEVVFLCKFQDAYDCYDALFSVNKELVHGWWTRKLEWR